MAISVTELTRSNAIGATGGTTGSFTPANGSLLVAIYTYQSNTDAAGSGGVKDGTVTISDSTGALTWTNQVSGTNALGTGTVAYCGKMTIATAPVTTGTSMTVTAATTTTAADPDWTLTILQVTGQSGSFGTTGNVSPTTGTGAGGGITAPLTVNMTLGASPASTSAVVGGIASAVSVAGSITTTPPTGYTELDDFGNSAYQACEICYATGTTGTSLSWTFADNISGAGIYQPPYAAMLEILAGGGFTPRLTTLFCG